MSVVDWIEGVELTHSLCGLKQVELVILLRLTGALDVYQQLSDNEKANVGLTKAALYKVFVMDPCTAYKCLTTQTLVAGKTLDVFFVAIKKMVVLFGELTEQIFIYEVCGWIHGSSETTIEGVPKHQSNAD